MALLGGIYGGAALPGAPVYGILGASVPSWSSPGVDLPPVARLAGKVRVVMLFGRRAGWHRGRVYPRPYSSRVSGARYGGFVLCRRAKACQTYDHTECMFNLTSEVDFCNLHGRACRGAISQCQIK